MTTIDLVILAGYFLAVLYIGCLCRRKDTSAGEQYLAGHGMGWIPIGLSVMVTSFSAINFVALPEEVFSHGLYVVVSFPVFFLAAWPISRIWMPFFHGMRLTSVYEYFERRFDRRVRHLCSGLFLCWRFFWMATMLYASGKIFGVFTGWNLFVMIGLCGFIATAYTTLGGIRAVMWTDVLQFGVLFTGIALAVIYCFTGNVPSVWHTVLESGRLAPYVPFDRNFLSFDPRIRMTFWSGLLGVFTAFMARYGADQVVMQRYFTARDLRMAQRGIWLNAFASSVSLSLLALLGLAVYARASASGMPLAGPGAALKALAAMIASFPTGLTGLVLAGILAATMSSVDSGINSCAAALWTDFPSVARRYGLTSRRLTFLLGGSVTLLSLVLVPVFGNRGEIFPIVNKFVNGLGSPLLAMMVLAMFSRRVTSCGMFYGGLTGLLASLAFGFFLKPLALQYYAVVNFMVCLAACYVFSVGRKN